MSRRLSSFQTNGWIEQKGHRNIKILQIDALTKISNEQNKSASARLATYGLDLSA
ncbi:hypothetical protein ACFQ3N_13880 [Virgibacillus byunsanensis]|uniref:Uncharacterized protein n=1 Tax=Virgibacillus byunsanensis TaxID=570945 RepID=A0ABW3LQF2_9BACI